MAWHDGNDAEEAFCVMGEASGRQQMGKGVCAGARNISFSGRWKMLEEEPGPALRRKQQGVYQAKAWLTFLS